MQLQPAAASATERREFADWLAAVSALGRGRFPRLPGELWPTRSISVLSLERALKLQRFERNGNPGSQRSRVWETEQQTYWWRLHQLFYFVDGFWPLVFPPPVILLRALISSVSPRLLSERGQQRDSDFWNLAPVPALELRVFLYKPCKSQWFLSWYQWSDFRRAHQSVFFNARGMLSLGVKVLRIRWSYWLFSGWMVICPGEQRVQSPAHYSIRRPQMQVKEFIELSRSRYRKRSENLCHN